jgi:hypothetical protein
VLLSKDSTSLIEEDSWYEVQSSNGRDVSFVIVDISTIVGINNYWLLVVGRSKYIRMGVSPSSHMLHYIRVP